ncbi:MAG: T9SS type A sorting domain-containing protein, partial [Bacteroidota bacterium]
DNGGNWTEVNTGLTSTNVWSLAINASGDVFAGTALVGIFRSTDNGGNWTEVNTGLTSTNVWSLAINASGDVFAGTALVGIFRSTDNGGNWTEVNTGLTNTSVWSLVINTSGDVFAGSWGGGIFRSMDNGGNWTEVNTGLTTVYLAVWSLAINASGDIFAGTSGGVFRSTDNGGNWTEVNTGLTSTNVRALAINSDGFIFAGTYASGVFRSVETIAGEIPMEYDLMQNYPNPFNPSTTIEFSVPRSGYATLQVYNMLGEHLATLVSENLHPGRYNVRWNARGVSSGIYFYRLQAGEFLETKKLVLVK